MSSSSFYSDSGITTAEADAVESSKNAAADSATAAAASATTASNKADDANDSAIAAAASATTANNSNVAAVASNLGGTNTIGTVAGNIADVNTVAAMQSDVDTVANATYKGKVETVANATYKGKVETVAATDYKSDVETVAETTYKGKVETVAETTYKGKVEAVAADLAGSNTIGAAVQSATNAATSATNASTSETNAASSESTAATHASNASTHATTASGHADDAEDAKTYAQAARDAAQGHRTQTGQDATAASASATSASNSATAAAGSESNVAADALAASNSATAAASSATTANTKAQVAISEASDAEGSATTASTASTAAVSANTTAQAAKATAEQARDAAVLSKTSAETAATNAGNSSSAASSSASTATTKASEAASSATTASTAATNAALSYTNASNAAASSANSATDSANAASAWDSFYTTYLGSYSVPPTVDTQGNALQTGALYYDTGAGSNTVGLYVYNGSSWVYSTNYNNVTAPYSLAQDLATNSHDINFGDNAKAQFGASNDLQIYHNGSNSIIDNTGTGSLIIQDTDGTGDILIRPKSGQTAIAAYNDNTVEIGYAGVTKLATTSTGIDVTGSVKAIESGDNASITMRGFNSSTDSGLASLFSGTSRSAFGGLIESGTNGQLVVGVRNNDNSDGFSVVSGGNHPEYMDDSTYDSELFTVRSSGNVGIGTGSPKQQLHISGGNQDGDVTKVAIGATGANAETHLQLAERFTGNDMNYGFSFVADGNDTNNLLIKNHNGSTTGAVALSVSRSSGRVGIGTTAPDAPLTVKGETFVQEAAPNGNSAIRVQWGSDGNTALRDRARLMSVGYDGVLELIDGSNVLTTKINSDGNSYLNGGNVGIGTTNPTAKLDVNGELAIRGGEGADDARMYFRASDNSNRFTIETDLDATTSNDILGFRSTTTDNILTLKGDGKVGIGTTSPTFDSGYSGLHISQTAPSIHLTPTSAGTTASDGYAISVNSSGIVRHINKENQPIEFHTNDTERMRIDSSGRVGIGTSSPSAPLSIMSETGASVPAAGDDSSHLAVGKNEQYGTMIGTLGSGDGYIQQQRFDGNATTYDLLVQPNGGNVGIGTASPTAKLDVLAGADQRLLFTTLGTDPFISAVNGANSAYKSLQLNGSDMKLMTGGSERLRIDSSGNLLVGKTSANSLAEGFEARASGLTLMTKDGGSAANFKRLTSDGNIVVFEKDGTSVGSIGTRANYLKIGHGDTGLLFNSASDAIYGESNTGGARDAAIDLGVAGVRFKDLYLSGGVHLGGTGSANKLDDYEEGTFTPTLTGATSGSASLTVASATYVKVGALVTVQCYLQNIDGDNSTATGNLLLGGLPFAAEKFTASTFTHVNCFDFDEEDKSVSGYTTQGGSTVSFVKGSGTSNINSSALSGTNKYLMFQATYKTTA